MSDYAADLTHATFAAIDALREGRDPEEAVRDCLRPQGLTFGDREIADRAIASAWRDFSGQPVATLAAYLAARRGPASPLTEVVNAELARSVINLSAAE